jgi:hypothetical protein
MAKIAVETATLLGQRIVQAHTQKLAMLSGMVPAEVTSLLARDLYQECAVHVGATSKVAMALCTDLQRWATQYQAGDNEQANDIAQLHWDNAIQSLEACAKVLEVTRLRKYIELAYVIGKNATGLIPLADTAQHLFEMLDKLKEIIDTWELNVPEGEALAKGLVEIELYAASSLLATQYATVQVGSLIRRPGYVISLDASLDEAGRGAAAAARTHVSQVVVSVRDEMQAALVTEGLTISRFVRFPAEGLWPDATAD